MVTKTHFMEAQSSETCFVSSQVAMPVGATVPGVPVVQVGSFTVLECHLRRQLLRAVCACRGEDRRRDDRDGTPWFDMVCIPI